MYIATAKRCALPNQPNQHCLIRSYAKNGTIFIEIQRHPGQLYFTLRVPFFCFYEKPNYWINRRIILFGDHLLCTHKKDDLPSA